MALGRGLDRLNCRTEVAVRLQPVPTQGRSAVAGPGPRRIGPRLRHGLSAERAAEPLARPRTECVCVAPADAGDRVLGARDGVVGILGAIGRCKRAGSGASARQRRARARRQERLVLGHGHFGGVDAVAPTIGRWKKRHVRSASRRARDRAAIARCIDGARVGLGSNRGVGHDRGVGCLRAVRNVGFRGGVGLGGVEASAIRHGAYAVHSCCSRHAVQTEFPPHVTVAATRGTNPTTAPPTASQFGMTRAFDFTIKALLSTGPQDRHGGQLHDDVSVSLRGRDVPPQVVPCRHDRPTRRQRLAARPGKR